MAGSILFLAFLLPPPARAQSPTQFASYDQAVQYFQTQKMNDLVGGLKKAEAPAAPSCDGPKKGDTGTPPLQAYECEINELEAAATHPAAAASPPRDDPRKQKANQLTFFLDNDNVLMGLVPSGNDEGFTHRMGVSYLRQLPKDQSLSFDVMSEIYTKDATPQWNSERVNRMLSHGEASYDQIVQQYESGDKIPVHYIDVTRFKAAYAKGDTFYFKAAMGLEVRTTSTEKGKLPPAASIQNWWHNTLGIYTYKYVPAEGQAATTEVDGKKITLRNGYEADPKLETTSRTSILAEGSVGTKIRFFEGRCSLQFEAGASLSTEGKKIVGPNSFGSATAKLNADVLRRKDGSPRLQASLGGAIFYFPSPEEAKQKVGTQKTFDLSSTHRLGKKGNTLQPFFSFWLPQGRQAFANMNDPDMIQRIGIRFNFGK